MYIGLDRNQDLTLRYFSPRPEAFPLQALLKSLEEPLSLPPQSAPACLAAGMLASRVGQVEWTSNEGDSLRVEKGEVQVGRAPHHQGPDCAILCLRRIGEGKIEREALSARCGYCPMPIGLNRRLWNVRWHDLYKEINSHDARRLSLRLVEHFWGGAGVGVALSDTEHFRCLHQRQEGQEPWECAVAVPASLVGHATLHWLQNGVVISSHLLDLGCPGALVVASADGLSTDLSMTRLVVDAAYDARLAQVRRRVGETLRDLIRDRHSVVKIAWTFNRPAFPVRMLRGLVAGIAIASMGWVGVVGVGVVGAAVQFAHWNDVREREQQRILQRLEELAGA
jgi:hypothetical protein